MPKITMDSGVRLVRTRLDCDSPDPRCETCGKAITDGQVEIVCGLSRLGPCHDGYPVVGIVWLRFHDAARCRPEVADLADHTGPAEVGRLDTEWPVLRYREVAGRLEYEEC